jgi:hypothetical protein
LFSYVVKLPKVRPMTVMDRQIHQALQNLTQNSSHSLEGSAPRALPPNSPDMSDNMSTSQTGVTPLQWRHAGFRIMGYEHATLRTDWVKDSQWQSAVDVDCTNLR